ncbi:MAG: ring-1,2-phenylacetyl-CoA epoxidase subunit PaaB [Cellvibrionaceae bacterium]|jgi:ring-1,2-phenylacetyl-CoA epoxidase subunit PaaB
MSQWPRWEVFKKDSERKPYQAVGSVHAADPEHALLNAKNVFVRRPSAVSLWVAPAAAIYSKTAQEIANEPTYAERFESTQRYAIFRKASHRRSITFLDYVGELSAGTPQMALQQALIEFADPPGLAWWVIPVSAIVSTEEDAAEAWFDPAKTKTYKQQSQYGFISKLREGRKGSVTDDK